MKIVLHIYILALLIGISVLYLGNADWWITTQLAQGPRWLAALPLAFFLLPAFRKETCHAPKLLLGALLVALPFMGYVINVSHPTAQGDILRVLTCNLEGQSPDAEKFAELLLEQGLDVLAIQGCPQNFEPPAGWKKIQKEQLAIVSRYNLSPFELRDANATFLQVSMKTPSGILRFATADCTTIAALQTLSATMSEAPQIIAGHFTISAENKAFHDLWPTLTNIFSAVGSGYGWTAWQTSLGISWGLRSQQIFASSDLRALSCVVGPEIGTGSRPLVAELVL